MTLMDRCTCVRTKASPHPLDLPDLPVSREASDRAQANAMPVLPCLKYSLEAKTAGEALLTAPALASDVQISDSAPLTSSGARESPKKRQLLVAMQKVVETRHQAPQAGPTVGSPLSKAPGATGRLLEPMSLEGKLSPKASLARDCPSTLDAQKLLSKESQTQTVSALLHVGPSATNSWQSQTLCDNTSPRRYMPSEPLPNYGGWSKKKKSKSRSPSKKQRDFAKNYW